MSREALVLLVCCCDFRDGAERLIPSKSLRNAVIRAFPGLFRILRMCAPRRAAAVVRPRGREKSADRRRRILISRLLIIRASVPRRKSPFPAYFKGFPAVSPLIPPYPAFLKYPVSPHWHFGYKAHIGVDRDSGLVHTVEATAANVHDATETSKLLTGDEDEVYGDSGYLGAEKRGDAIIRNKAGRKIKYRINRRPSQVKKLSKSGRYAAKKAEHAKSSVRAKVEHVFGVVKKQLRFRKTRYRGLEKQRAKFNIMFALANLILADRPCLAA